MPVPLVGLNTLPDASFTKTLAALQALGWGAVGGAALSLDAADHVSPPQSLKATYSAGAGKGIIFSQPTVKGRTGQKWIVSASIKGPAGATYGLYAMYYNDDLVYMGSGGTIITTTGSWQRFSTPAYILGADYRVGFSVQSLDGLSTFVGLDEAQVEPNLAASTFFPAKADRAPGALVTQDYQYEFRNLLFGSGTDIMTESVDGILGLPSTIMENFDRQAEHGAFPGPLRMGTRVMPFNVHVLNGRRADIESVLDHVKKAFRPPALRHTTVEEPLVFKRPGQVKQRMLVRCEKRDFASKAAVASGHAAGSVQLVATDPIIYSNDARSRALTLAAGVSAAASVRCYNAGDHEDGVDPTIEISGPARNPRVQRLGDGDPIFAIDTDIAVNERLVVDMKTWAAYVINHTTGAYLRDVFGSIRTDSKWFTLLPGDNTIVFSRANTALTGSPTTLTVRWRDGWS